MKTFLKALQALLGVTIAGVGLAIILADVRAAYLASTGAHTLNLVAGGVLMFVGGHIVAPAWADALANQLLQFLGRWSPTSGGSYSSPRPPY